MQYKYLFITIGVILLGFILKGCASANNNLQGNKPSFEHISQDDAKSLMDCESDYIILDVRTIEEYNDKHITGAICIPNETILYDKEPQELQDKSQLLLVYCRSGNRSRDAAQKLANLGYTNVKEFGGINTWKYDVE